MLLRKLQDTSYDCAQKGNQFSHCSPLTTDTWVNGTSHYFVWNYHFPFYVSSDSLDLNMYYIKNYQYTPIKNWTDLTTSDGALKVTVDDTWFPTPSYGGNKTWQLYLYYLPSGMNASAELQNTNSLYPRPYNFTVIQLPSTSPPNSASNPNSPGTTATTTTTDQQGGLPGWGIALIVIAAVAVIAALCILAWAILIYFPRKRKRRMMTTAPPPNEKTESIYSHSPMVAAGLRSSVSVGGTTTTASISHRADSPSYPSIHHITSNVTMSESIRQMIHRPDWTTTDQDIDQEKRRRLGEELLQRQLAEDGTMIKQTQPTRLASMTSQIPKARTAIVVAESSDSLSHSSSTNSLELAR